VDAAELRARTKAFALRVIRLYRALPKFGEAQVIGNQLLRSATSVGANYRAVCRCRTHAEFVSKMSIVLEEADESLFWLELLSEAQVMPSGRLAPVTKEADELVAIFAAARKTARGS